MKAEKLRLTRAQADKEETRVKREAGDLVEAEAVTREWAGILRDLPCCGSRGSTRTAARSELTPLASTPVMVATLK